MAKIGMVGTSHTQGHQPILKKNIRPKNFYQQDSKKQKFTRYLHEHLSDVMSEHEFINQGSAGRGTERYLESLVYLKKEYDIDILLLEYSQNRKNNSYHIREEYMTYLLETLYNNPDFKDEYTNEILKNNSYFVKSIQSLFNNDIHGILESIPTKKVKNWKEVCAIQYYQSVEPSFLGIKDILQTKDLCKMLDIKVVEWEFTNWKYFRNQQIPNCLSWIKKNVKDDLFCDKYHASNHAYREAAVGFFKPLIDAI